MTVRHTSKTLAGLSALALGGTLLSGCGLLEQVGAGTPTPSDSASPSSGAPDPAARATTAKVVKASQAFLATLSSDQRAKVVLGFDDPAKQAGWSNLPNVIAQRAGVELVDLDAAQRDALTPVLQASLSQQGWAQVQDIRAADDRLAELLAASGGPPKGGPPVSFGHDHYFIAFFGEPSTSAPFQVAFGGHHLAQNITFSPDAISDTPEFVGTEPTSFQEGGNTYQPLGQEISAATALVAALDPDQLAAATLKGTYDDALLLAGKDGQFPAQPEGVVVADLSQQQQDEVTAVLRAWVGDADEATAVERVKGYVADYDKTRVGVSGTPAFDQVGDYLRVDGPNVWIELSATAPRNAGNAVHYHSVYRDEALDYGGK